jgi:hypothetical protein
LEKCQEDFLLELPGLKELWANSELETSDVLPLLFDYQFHHFINHEVSSVATFFGSDLSPLWQTISSAEKARSSVDNSTNSSTKSKPDEGKIT